MSKISLLFSGGVDSSYSCFKLAEKHSEIHLLNYYNGYGQYHLKKAELRYKKIKKALPNIKLYFHQYNIKPLFEKIIVNNIIKDHKKYKSCFIWCLGCKLSMHTATIAYNIKNNIKISSDGSSGSTSEMIEQMPLSVEYIKEFYNRNDQKFIVPVYNIERQDEIKFLKEKGLLNGIQLKDRFIGLQASCVPGELYYLPFVLFNIQPEHYPETIRKFFNTKTKILTELLKNGEINELLF